MTLEEEQEFRRKVIETILPHAINMTEDQIRNIIQTVEKNKTIYQMVLEQCSFNK